ncbi:MAG: Rrf2 family transcriptional regulator [Eubacteriales bacterium]|nr:Rrf2 family transcriptional regulator [Eubacteriales bacterium]
MKLSTKGRYGLRAMVDIAVHAHDAPVSIKDISRREEISERYLEQLMMPLKKTGLLASTRGAKGGYRLAKPAENITIGEILRALEGDLAPVDCKIFMGEACVVEEDCVMRFVWQRISEGINQAVDGLLLSDLVNRVRDGGIEGCKL